MKRFLLFVTTLTLSTITYAQCIPGHNIGTTVNTGGGFLWAQSFIATCDGNIEYVELISDATGTISAGTLSMYNGSSTTGAFYTQSHPPITITNTGDPIRIYITGTVPVTNTNQYTFEFFVDNVNVLADFNAGYTGGEAWQDKIAVPAADFTFNVSILPACQDSAPTIFSFTANTDTICAGDTSMLTVNGFLNDALWWQLYTDSCGGSPVATDTSGVFYVTPDSTTTYYVRGEDTTNCVDEDSVVCMSVNIVVTTVDTSVTQAGSMLTASETGATYQWLNCDSNYAVIQGETGQTYSPSSNGNYAVEITKNGCIDTSACIAINNVGIHQSQELSGIQVFPNPSNGVLNLNLGETTYDLSLVNETGQQVLLMKDITGSQTIDLDRLNSGVYFLQLRNEDDLFHQRLLLQK